MVHGTYCKVCEDTRSFLKIIYDDCKIQFDNEQLCRLTIIGNLSNITFVEKDFIHLLSSPTGYLLKIGCKYGEIFHNGYVAFPITMGRNCKYIKKYINSQITFEIQHPDSGGATGIPPQIYKIKLFRNGVFHVTCVKDINMFDLVKPIEILCKYLSYNVNKDVQVIDQKIAMRSSFH
jgi:hypothetical protein